MTENENCNHDWVYKPKNYPPKSTHPYDAEIRQKRICRNCFEMQRQGLNEREIYFRSYFAAPPNESKSSKELIKDWENFK